MSNAKRARPLSPHLTIWRWGPHMAVSIMHRAAGVGLATVGAILLVWWLVALATGPDAYAAFRDTFTDQDGGLNILGWLFGIGLTWVLFQHMASGIRHLVLDTGANYELKGNKRSAQMTWAFSAVMTLVFWAWLIWGK
mgnify:CR=1